MSATALALIAPEAFAVPPPFAAALHALGYVAIPCRAGARNAHEAKLRVLFTSAFATSGECAHAYASDTRPAVIVAATADDANDALAMARAGDEVARADESPAALGHRLSRLMQRAEDVEELAMRREHRNPVTRLPDRSTLNVAFWQFYDDAALGKSKALLLFDLDHFLPINQQFGIAGGDRVLREIALRLRHLAAPGDLLFQLEGDEFVCLLARESRKAVLADAERLRACVPAKSFELPDGSANLSASGGLTFLDGRAGAHAAIHQAIHAMFMAKAIGRNNMVLYDDVAQLAATQDRKLDLSDITQSTAIAKERLANMISVLGRQLVEEARREANQDALTKLHNRRYFDERIARELELARKTGGALSIALIDIDDFRVFNNTHGHPTGDAVLRHIAKTATVSIRSVDWLARYGGEEFCLVMPATLTDAMHVAERIRRHVEAAPATSLDERPLAITVCIGVVQFDPHRDPDPVHLVQRASEALHVAKNTAGKNHVVAG